MKQRTSILTLALVPCLVALTLADVAWAQLTSAQQSAMRSNCRSDFMSKCSGVTPGGKEALACLQKNVASLSPGCKTAVAATIPAPAPAAAKPATAPAAAPTPAPAAAPPAPATRAIVAVPPPPAALRSGAPKPPPAAKPPAPPKQAAVPPPAAATPAEVPPAPTPQQLSAIKVTCGGDFKRSCRGVPPGGAEAIGCLQRNAAKLAPDCKTSLAALGDAMPAPSAPGAAPPTQRPNAPVVMTAVIGRACLRDLALHCRKTGIGDGQKIACLTARGSKLAPLCKAALKITDPVR